MTCRYCAGKGLILVKYESGEPFDLAVCSCGRGRYFRQAGAAFIRHCTPGIDPVTTRIANLEDFEDVPAPPSDGSYTEAIRCWKLPFQVYLGREGKKRGVLNVPANRYRKIYHHSLGKRQSRQRSYCGRTHIRSRSIGNRPVQENASDEAGVSSLSPVITLAAAS